jgi:TonB family protein
MFARLLFPLLAFALLITSRVEVIAAEPDRVRVVWKDGHKSEMSEKELKQYTSFSIRPEYPMEAQRAKITGAGIYLLYIDKITGGVARVEIETSAGSKLLDGYATTAFKRWQFKPGTFVQVRMPCAFNILRPINPWVF